MKNEKVYQVEEEEGKFLIKMNPGSLIKPRFLAKNPETNELFLLFENHTSSSYFLLKGSQEKGLRPCKPLRTQLFDDCFCLIFEQAGNFSSITDPDSLKYQKPLLQSGKTLQELETVPFLFCE